MANERQRSTARSLWQRWLLPALIIVPIYFLFLSYPPLRLLSLLLPDWQADTLTLALVFVGPAIGRLCYEWFPGPITRRISAITLSWCGLCFIGLSLLLPFELLTLLLPLPPQQSGLVLLAATVALGFVALANAQLLPVKSLRLRHPSCTHSPSRPLRLVQISDVHIGSRQPGYLARIVRRLKEMPADYVLITGDLVDFRDIPIEALRPLGDLSVPVLFAIGNHERYVDLEAICDRLRRVGVTVLRNETRSFDGIQFIGVDDADRRDQLSRTLPQLEPAPDQFRVLLYHRPDDAEAAARWGAHLMLCGHTHAGQIKPFHWLVRRQFPRMAGLFELGTLLLYVSPGTGTWGPVMRLGTRGEITWMEVSD